MSTTRLSDRIDWNDLRLLMLISETGYIAPTAKRLALDPTTVTRRLKRLEKQLELKLIERIKGGVILSPGCHRLIDAARSLDRSLDDAFPESFEPAVLQGTVRVSLTDFLVPLFAADLTSFHQQNPQLTLDFRESYSVHSLDNRETDIAVRFTENPSPGLVGLRHENITWSTYGTPAFRGGREKGWPWISWNLPHAAHDEWIDEFDPKGHVIARSGSLISHVVLAAQGLGVVALPDGYVQKMPDCAALERLGDGWCSTLWVLTHEELRHVPRVKETMHLLSDAIKKYLSI